MKPVDVKSGTYIKFDVENHHKDPKIKAGDYMRISKYRNIFAKVQTPNQFQKVFEIKKVKNTVPWTYSISDLKGEETVGTFNEKVLQK